MNRHVNAIAGRLSLRPPQRRSLEILDRITEIVPPKKGADVSAALAAIGSEFPTVTDFERDFPSVCFALATGVGKTRLMGAFISYLHQAKGVRHFFVLAPNLTIYNKLIADFTPNTPKYVFQGIAEFAVSAPEIITGDTYQDGRGVRGADLYTDTAVHINIFNISKINSEVRGGKTPRIKRLSEYIGESYYEYLSKLDDLVLIMDESHRYRATAGVRAINVLQPILGLELTATPQVESGSKAVPFKNVIYSYPLSSALTDGFVKEPAVATRENFDPKNYDKDGLERLKLEDGVRVHENTKVELEVYARQNDKVIVKPFMLIVAENTEHADALVRTLQDDSFFEGRYKGRVLTVHSNLSGEEKDETVQQLLSVEDPANPTEIVVHVNMLKEGWDVTNLYTIVPLRAANSRTLVEQSIGRGLRLPYGQRVGVAAVDRLTIVSHDKFQEIIDEANRPDSIIRTGVVIGKDIPERGTRPLVVESELVSRIAGATEQGRQPPFEKAEERKAALEVLSVIKQYERLPRSSDLNSPEVQREIEEKVVAARMPSQGQLEGIVETVDLPKVIAETVALFIKLTIDIPRIIIVPKGEVTCGFKNFDLEVGHIRLQPVAKEILIQHLHDHSRHHLINGDGIVAEARLEDCLVRGLVEFDDISYDEHAELLYKLAGQAVRRLQSNLKTKEDVLNVLQYHQQALVNLIYAQMQEHYEEKATAYEIHVSKGFTTLRSHSYSVPADEAARDFRMTVEERQMVRGMFFGGFKKSLYPFQKFDSDSERRFSVILEDEEDVLKWVRPAKGDFQIHYRHDAAYEPDFAVETKTAKYLCEPKRADEMADTEVIAKAKAAAIWCRHATAHEQKHGGKPWSYLLIPHDAIADNKTLQGLAATYTFRA
ncbi:MAG: DEAD/DEAH box helicase family protein [Nitrospirae bacterium]|nr:DEAD/DEAH box helicase family protein [Nitrospirota bacterium]